MAIYVYVTATGQLYSYCPNDTDPVASAATLQAAGLTAVSGLAPQDATHAWDPVSKSVLSKTNAAATATHIANQSARLQFKATAQARKGQTLSAIALSLNLPVKGL